MSYISIPKSSSTTIKFRLFNSHSDFRILHAKGEERWETIKNDFKFTFLREPTSRLVSGIGTVLHRLKPKDRAKYFDNMTAGVHDIDG